MHWNLDFMKGHEGPKDWQSIFVGCCNKITYDPNYIILLTLVQSHAFFHVSSVSYGCPMSRGKSFEIEAGHVCVYQCQRGVFASTKAGCMKIILACTVNTLYSYL